MSFVHLAGFYDPLGLVAIGAVVVVGLVSRARGVWSRDTYLAGTDGEPRLRPVDEATLADTMLGLTTATEQGAVLNGLARDVHEHFGLAGVVVRVRNTRARIFEARAFAGLDPEDVARVSTFDVPVEDFEELTRGASVVGRCFFVPADDPHWSDHVGMVDSVAGDGVLVVPFHDEREETLGYLRASTRSDPGVRVAAQIRMLVAAAASGLASARLRSMLERRELEYAIVSERLREAHGLRDNFVANVSHELRTPLTSVKAYAETLARGIDDMDAATRREFVGVIEHEAARLDQIFDDLLDVAHLEGRARRVVHDRIDLRDLARTVASDQHDDLVGAGLDLRVYGPESPVYVQGDADGLRQVLYHLLDNARKFTPEGGRVRVELHEDGGSAVVTVEDTGIGIPEPERHRVFERFYQVDGSATRSVGGQGLGLALCHDVVGWHHGRIRIEEGAEGGVRIVVQLPLRGLVVRQVADDPAADPAERMQWESFLGLATHLVSELTRTRVASVMLVDELYSVLRIEAAVGLDEDVVQNTMVGPGEGVAGQVWERGESVLAPDLDEDVRFSGLRDDVNYERRSLLSVPLLWQGRTVGVLNVNVKHDGSAFDDDDRLLLEALAERLVVALDRFERFRAGFQRLAAVESGVRAMLDVGRERQSAIRELFAKVGVTTGRRLGLDEEQLRSLAYALRTYDVGLNEISGRILRKVTPLSRDERQRIEEHVRLGAELVADLEPSPQVRKLILHHHENVDGSGYPDGLRGEAIPVGARIVRLVDVLSALLQDRPFRSAVPLGPAIGLVEEGVGQAYCPRVTPVFLEVVDENASRIREVLAPVTAESPAEIELQLPTAAVETGSPTRNGGS